MKAECTRENIQRCMYADENISDFDYSKIDDELEELERLAEIGRATELGFERCDRALFVKYHPVEEDDFDDERYVDVNNSPTFDSIEELLEWAKEQTK